MGARAETFAVDNRPGSVAMFSSFADAHDAASSGDTILLSGSPVSYGTFNVSKQLFIRGAGQIYSDDGKRALPTSTSLSLIFDEGSSGSVIQGLSGQMQFTTETISFADCRLTFNTRNTNISSPGGHQFQRCFFASGFSAPSFCKFTNCIFPRGTFSIGASNSGSDRSGVGVELLRCTIGAVSDVFREQPTWTIEDSILVGVSSLPADVRIINSHALDANNISDVFMDDDANINSPPSAFQLRRNSSSPALGATQEQDLGAFGGVNPISVNLSTGSPRIETLNVSDSVTATSGLRIQLEAVAGE